MAFGAIVMDTKEVEELQKGLASLPEAIPKVTSFAINYAVDKAKTNAWRAIGARYNINQGRVYDALTLFKATPTNLSGGIVANRLYAQRSTRHAAQPQYPLNVRSFGRGDKRRFKTR
jgi:hypothetical protein